MRPTTKWSERPRRAACGRCTTPAPRLALPKKARAMPTRGYRKGVSDGKQPRPHVMKMRASTPTHGKILAESDQRSITISALMAEILDAHVNNRRPELPHPRGTTAEALRELCRQGNNLNQIARQANLMRLHLLEQRTLQVLDTINDTARKLTS